MNIFKMLLLLPVMPLFAATAATGRLADSVGVENLNGKKLILHKVEPKETYYALGRRYNIKPNVIIQYNNNQVLQPGQIVKVPTEVPFAEIKPTTIAAGNQTYKVAATETLYSIAKRFGTTVAVIKTDNNLTSDIVIPGQVLNIRASGIVKPNAGNTDNSAVSQQNYPVQTITQTPVQNPPTPLQNITHQNAPINRNLPQTTTDAGAKMQQYKVSDNDNLFTIAKMFNTTPEDIMALNKLPNRNIMPGQMLTVRSGMPPTPAPQPQAIAPRDSTNVAASDSLAAARHNATNRFGLFEKIEKGPATWMDDPSFDPAKKLVLHRTAPIGSVIKITNPMTNRTTYAKVAGRFADSEANRDVILVVTKNVAESLGAMDKRFRVNISYGVANEQQ